MLLAALPAHADLYRWIDPDSGSVKLSSMPPSDPRVSAEVVPNRAPPPPKPPAQAAVIKPPAEAKGEAVKTDADRRMPQK